MFGNFNNNSCCPVVSTDCCPVDPVYEQPINNCVQKDYYHEIKHIFLKEILQMKLLKKD